MNPYQIKLTCDICGEEGVATMKTIGRLWDGGSAVHSDPRICSDNLARRKKLLDEKEKQLNSRNPE